MSATNPKQPIPDNQADQKLVGIRGWLIIPAVVFASSPLTIFYILDRLWSLNRTMGLHTGLFFTIIRIVLGVAILFYILAMVSRFFKRHQNAPQTSIYLIATQLIAPMLLLFFLTLGLLVRLRIREMNAISDDMVYTIQEIVLRITVLFYTFVAALRFFTKSQYAPRTCVRYVVIYSIASLLQFILRHVFLGGVDPLVLAFAFVSYCIAAAIWILYFRISKRVKATFVKQEDSFGLPYKIVMPIRYFTQRRISWLAFSAVALCVFIVIVVMTVMTGLVSDFKQRNHRFAGDCVVGTRSLVGFAYYEEFMGLLERADFVEGVSPVIGSYALKRRRGSGQDDVAEIMGIDPAKHARVTGFGETLYYHKEDVSKAFEPPYDPNLPGCVPGIDLVLPRDSNSEYLYEVNLPRIGYSISCFPLTASGAPAQAGTDMINTKTFYYSDNSHSGLPRVDGSLVYLPFEQTQRLCDMAGPIKRANAIHIKFKPNVSLQKGCDQTTLLWQKFRRRKADAEQAYLLDTVTVQSWKDYRRASIAPMEKEQAVMTVMFALVGITTVFIIFVVFYMIVSHKSKDIGILKSIGASGADIIELFSGFAFLVGLIGSGVGLYAGWLFLLTINRIEDWLSVHFGFQLWDRTIYAIGDIPSRIEPKVLVIVLFSAIAACLAGALVPSWQAARQKPAETLQVSQL